MRFDVVTIFPDMVLDGAMNGVTGRAITQGIVGLSVWNPRDYTADKHKTVDDRPYGGGPGMVMKYQPLKDAIDSAKHSTDAERVKVVYLSPQGKPLTQKILNESIDLDQLILVAGRYEGIDERFIEDECQEEWSLGDFVISGGELAALVVIDAVSRLLPGVLGDDESARQDSHMQGILDFPHYTRPEIIADKRVPSVLLSGNHKGIERWRLQQALGRTWQKRPDLLLDKELTTEEQALLEEFKIELKNK
ncbi:tRNA (guanine37-N1)-methyltransferase [Bathymodiolus platifrons methanotrophic gill symbiont]|uniref:tRNA (guanosine(37)-N1)-methyltransferase TrmD n=1 Tax=Bathymodiolus platifrons methanotrophic gill symbiont TaxID=113268 RepID=UPI000B411108|nr:tRNA (guanosine(37)-N1)-methyltransferase TrmD [Bathymodiolus platifrons methanotrophic gill symbiont]MCK5870113.1 tRNA (guanosine(37)-N1)-methyltransferase TrmD [Methyloprofundus sp.]TXK95132.1 tRNA (guanosine(37)-N1)-methyltransferase TrmD [Methylococcaceae bacterium CS4]TXK97333.1 tRNA (guanosine(37)-N1)-methyltransferase TrmD [Methylococcaceae bacterium HT1]TXK98194.1 tRNA (guanosine(37)-N1)-methyltransferase TrmD [Methylococcaceae bacterium CS5]TXL04289.1 tRNA (guanosine(37)-N1)-methyl